MVITLPCWEVKFLKFNSEGIHQNMSVNLGRRVCVYLVGLPI